VSVRESHFESLLKSWERALRMRNRRPKTLTTYTESCNQFRDWLIANKRPTDPTKIKPRDIEGFIIDLLETRSASTARVRYSALQQFFKWLAAEGEIDASPMEGMEPPAQSERPVPVLSDNELRALLATCESKPGFEARRDTALIRMFVATGIRLGEMTGLRVEDVDLDEQVALVVGKGDRGRYVAFGNKATYALDRYLRERRRHAWAEEPWLWLGTKGRLGDSGITQILRRRAEQAGVEGLHPHRFRHTFAHRWLAAGGTEGALQSVAGWRSPQMLQRYGASAKSERARAEYHRLGLEDDL
jgi:site-specific recombinase XerD